MKREAEEFRFAFLPQLSAEDMAEIAKLNNGKRYFTDTLEQQQRFTSWKPED